jgi:hypothetical protein
MEAIRSSDESLLTRATGLHITKDETFHSHRRGNLKSYVSLTGWAQKRRLNFSPARYNLGFYIPEDGILHSDHSENLKYYVPLTGYTL